MDNFTQVETDEKYSFLVPRVTYGGCSMLNKVIYDPYHTHIGLVRPGSAPAGTRPPTHKPTHLPPLRISFHLASCPSCIHEPAWSISYLVHVHANVHERTSRQMKKMQRSPLYHRTHYITTATPITYPHTYRNVQAGVVSHRGRPGC